MKTETSRYTIVAITLHWVMAALLLFMIWLGWNMDDNEVRFQLHKSIGILLLFLTLVRVIWRVMNPPPPLPEEMPAYEKLASHLVHMAFYGLMIILPLAGWLLVSTSKFKVPTVLFETVSWPHLPAPDFLRGDIAHVIIENIHSKGAWVLIILLGLHVAGAVKHEFAAEDGVLKKMLPGLFGKPATPPPHEDMSAPSERRSLPLPSSRSYRLRAQVNPAAPHRKLTRPSPPQTKPSKRIGMSITTLLKFGSRVCMMEPNSPAPLTIGQQMWNSILKRSMSLVCS